jgi:uncharacterized protein DUF4395
MAANEIFTFPNPVNEVSARVVAGGVVVMATTTLASRRRWLIVPLAYGFVARALSGPTLSPLGQLATRVVTPRLPIPAKEVPGPPKRFAQTLGAFISVTALMLAFPMKRPQAANALVGMIAVFATLESGFGFCIGCRIFAVLMKMGVIPEDVCAECANIWSRPTFPANAPTTEQPAAD